MGIEKGIKPPFPLKKAYLEQQKREGMEFQQSHDGVLPSNDFWNYLRWRRELNPKRFDHYHPGISCMMRSDYAKRHEDKTEIGSSCHEVPYPPISHAPEPSTMVSFALGIFFTVLFAWIMNPRKKQR